MANSTTLTDRELNVLALELAQGSPDPSTRAEPYTPYSVDAQEACDALNAEDRPYEADVELGSVDAQEATRGGRNPVGMVEYLMGRDLLVVLENRAADATDEPAQSAAVNVLAWIGDPNDRNFLASNQTVQKTLIALGPAGSGDLTQPDLDWIDTWGDRFRSRMQELPLPSPCRLAWVTAARAVTPQKVA